MKVEDFITAVQGGEALTLEDRANLKSFATSKSFQRLLTTLLRASDERAFQLLAVRLNTPEGVQQASVLQGEARGLVFAVEQIAELVAIEETQEKEEHDNG